MSNEPIGGFERELASLTTLVESLKDQSVPLESLAAAIDRALEQVAVCDSVLGKEEAKVAAVLKRHQEVLTRTTGHRFG